MKNNNHTFWAMVCHLSSLVGFLLPGFSIIGPLIVWGLKRQDHPLIMKNGRNVINFILSYWIYTFGLLAVFTLFAVCVMLPGSMLFQVFMRNAFTSFVMFFYGASAIVYICIYGFVHVVLPIYGGIKALNGEVYRYPFTLSLLKETEPLVIEKTKKAK